MLNVAVHADRAAVDESSYPVAGRRLDQVADRGDVDGPVGVVRNARLAVDGRNVKDDINVTCRRGERGAVPQVAWHQLDTGRIERRGTIDIPDQGAHMVSAPYQLV